ncbi:MAG: hypothetical protein HY324_02265 [Chlamydiia bacterium]|nr:hypothetical protein [Chlamydiia bacterium]
MNHQLSFDIQDVFEDARPPRQAPHLIMEEVEDGEELIHLLQNKDPSQARLQRMEPHIIHIQNVIRTLSQQHGWYPERQQVETVNDRVTLIIPLPDHIVLPVE